MTPATELRDAAKRLRCDHSFPVQPPEGTLWKPGPCSKCGVPYGTDTVPDVFAEPLVGLLEDTAEGFEIEGHTEPVVSTEEYALTIARVINKATVAGAVSSETTETTR